jgi:hypothetical protein
MSGSTDNRASSAAENPPDRSKVFDLALARRMLPLVMRIADDLILSQKQLAGLLPEMEQLQRQRRTLPWPERSRLYRLREEIASSEQSIVHTQAELETLGLVPLEMDQARIGFPTFVNNRRAFFSWQPGEDGILYWNYAGDDHRQAIPVSWLKQANLTLTSRR